MIQAFYQTLHVRYLRPIQEKEGLDEEENWSTPGQASMHGADLTSTSASLTPQLQVHVCTRIRLDVMPHWTSASIAACYFRFI